MEEFQHMHFKIEKSTYEKLAPIRAEYGALTTLIRAVLEAVVSKGEEYEQIRRSVRKAIELYDRRRTARLYIETSGGEDEVNLFRKEKENIEQEDNVQGEDRTDLSGGFSES